MTDYGIPTLRRAVTVLAQALRAGQELSAADLAARTGVGFDGYSTLRRSLVAAGYLHPVTDGVRGAPAALRLTNDGWRLAGYDPIVVGPPVKATTRTRRCLSCRKEFGSHGAGNHVCPDCKRTSTWAEGGDDGRFGVCL